jgi:hypothetical protein
MAAEDYHADFYDHPRGHTLLDPVDDQDDYFSEKEWRDLMAANRGASKTQQKQTRNDKIKRNKFYVGAESALDRNWGHPTLPKAIAHAEELMEEQGRDEMFVVQIIRVVRRRKAPVEVERV